MKTDYDICVVGAGAAGMMASIAAARHGRSVIVLEKQHLPGIKLAITGKGRCNFTNDSDIPDIISQMPGNGQFLYSALNTFPPSRLIDELKGLGVKSKVERGGRVFPESDSAKDIVRALASEMRRVGVTLVTRSRVTAIERQADSLGSGFIVVGGQRRVSCAAVVVATGGITYPATGSTGDGYKVLASLGHHVHSPLPSLVPLISSAAWVPSLQGLSLRNVSVALINDAKVVAREFGEMLFTDEGVSGPVILTLSRTAVQLLDSGVSPSIAIDLKPALDADQLDARVTRDLSKYARRAFRNGLDDLLPRLLIPVVVSLSGISPDKQCGQVTREERRGLVDLLKHLTIPIAAYGPLSEAIVTQGGIAVDEVNPSTMESRIVPHLFICGELLDVDGYTGGYNLQAAFSTGYVAGESAALAV